MFGGLGMTELAVIAGVALLIFGPRQLPKLARSLGETVRELRGASKALTEEVKGVQSDFHEVDREVRR